MKTTVNHDENHTQLCLSCQWPQLSRELWRLMAPAYTWWRPENDFQLAIIGIYWQLMVMKTLVFYPFALFFALYHFQKNSRISLE